MIQCAGKKKLSENPVLPNVGGAVKSFMQNMRIGIIKKTIVSGKTQSVPIWKDTRGMRQPMSETRSIRKEGDRSWKWHIFYFLSDVDLQTGDKVIFLSRQYKIMEKEDWSQHGFIRYNAIEDFTTSVTE